jgi:hypothetical protein
MYKPISTKAHGVIDYVTIGKLLALPHVMGWSKPLTRGVTALALGKLLYTFFTRHELGVVKKIPMQAHLAMDAASGAALCAMPMLLAEEDDVGACGACCALGLFDIAVAPLTETQMRGMPEGTIEYREQVATARDHLENAGKERRILAGRPI